MVTLSVGKIVQYVLGQSDVEGIELRRGSVSRIGGPVAVGDVVPAIVVRPHNEDSTFNGQAFLDGNDTLYLASVPYSEKSKPGTWH